VIVLLARPEGFEPLTPGSEDGQNRVHARPMSNKMAQFFAPAFRKRSRNPRLSARLAVRLAVQTLRPPTFNSFHDFERERA